MEAVTLVTLEFGYTQHLLTYSKTFCCILLHVENGTRNTFGPRLKL